MADTLAQLIREQAATIGGRVAFTFEERDLTYGELDAISSQVARGLLAEGVQAGDRVAILDKNAIELFELMFGAAKVGAVLCPVNWRLAPPEVAHIVNDAQAKVLVVGQEFLPVLDKIEGDLTTVKRILVLGEHPGHEDYAVWRDRQPADDPGVELARDDVALQFYTSGTTGLPKGAMLSGAALHGLVPAANDVLGLGPDTVSLVVMPLFHVAGAGWALFGLYNGARNVMLRDVDFPAILDAIPRYGITDSVFVPAVLQFLLMTPGVESTDFSSLRTILYGASPISEEVLVASGARFGCKFVQAYGLTETNGAAVLLPAEDHDPEGPNRHRLRAAGIPIPGVELRVVDDVGNDLPTTEIGEVWIKSPANMVGYWNMPEASAAALTPDGWFKSGDAGYLDADGYLYIADRVKDMIISGGENVYPAEVESVLMSHSGVADAAVIGVPDDRWGEAVKAIVVRADADVTESDVITWCRDLLAHYKCPTSVDWAEMLPRNPSGKILKRELREPYWAGRDRQV
ncbi:MAG: fatty acid--CoA ligase [Acidimicrobiia bacterium]